MHSMIKSLKASAGVTLIDLLAVIFMIDVPILTGMFVARNFGVWPGVAAGILAAPASIGAVVAFYKWSWRLDDRRCAEVREQYRGIYRVIQIPPDKKNVRLAESAEIRIGDYGWEAEPFRDTKLIYLQGLSPVWEMVWHAGFEPHEIGRASCRERV